MQQSPRRNLAFYISIVLAVILVLMPFHAFITVWAASNLGHYMLLRAWKEVILLVLTPFVIWTVIQRPKLWRELDTWWIFWASVCYAALHIGLGVLAYSTHHVTFTALTQALVINLRPFLMFWLCLIIAAQTSWLKTHWRPLMIVPGAVVIVFGLLQLGAPHDFLRHFGYGPATIVPYETVDQKLDYQRVQSFLRGANPLGAYLILIITALVTVGGQLRYKSKEVFAKLFFLVGGIKVIAATYSRSAWLGLAAALAAALWWKPSRTLPKRQIAVVLTVGTVLVIGGALTLRNNDRFQNTFFHTDEHSRSALSSNQSRAAALRDASLEVIHEPFGRGPGTAGPASAHNLQPARIAENYYLQIAQETGWFGLLLFLLITCMITVKLWHRRHESLSCVMLASLIGLSVVNLVSHAWTDDTISLLWWGFAGIALAPAILPVRSKK